MMQKKNYLKIISLDQYNKMLRKTFESGIIKEENFQVFLEGRKKHEKCIIEIKDSFPESIRFVCDQSDSEEYIKLIRHQDLKNILHSYALKYKLKIIPITVI